MEIVKKDIIIEGENLGLSPGAETAVVVGISQALLQPNFIFNSRETDKRKQNSHNQRGTSQRNCEKRTDCRSSWRCGYRRTNLCNGRSWTIKRTYEVNCEFLAWLSLFCLSCQLFLDICISSLIPSIAMTYSYYCLGSLF